MKSNFQHIGLAKLCAWFGITRQAYYQNVWKAIDVSVEEELVVQEVRQIRKNHPKLGTRKLYEKMRPFMQEHCVKMGRDALFNLLSINNLQIRRRKRKIQTTQSFHWLRKYPNLIREYTPNAPNQLWVSDITYWKINEKKHLYISLITDVYSRTIVGYSVAETLETVESIKALKMALKSLGHQPKIQLIHHSDRGVQYCSKDYVKLLKAYQIEISMTEKGDPLENAIAERINGIIKDEYLLNYQVNNIKEASKRLDEAIRLYNTERPHMSIGNKVPQQVHQQSLESPKPQKLWKNYYKEKNHVVNTFQD